MGGEERGTSFALRSGRGRKGDLICTKMKLPWLNCAKSLYYGSNIQIYSVVLCKEKQLLCFVRF